MIKLNTMWEQSFIFWKRHLVSPPAWTHYTRRERDDRLGGGEGRVGGGESGILGLILSSYDNHNNTYNENLLGILDRRESSLIIWNFKLNSFNKKTRPFVHTDEIRLFRLQVYSLQIVIKQPFTYQNSS